MASQTERRFLLESDEWRQLADKGIAYEQGYLSIDPERNVRVRIGDSQAKLTIKGEAQGNTRPEFEYPIPLGDGEQLEKLCLKPILEKTRYTLQQNGLTWEIDEYAGENKGLVVAEVETEEPIDEIPPWIGTEISGDDRYRNINLVEHPFGSWHEKPQKPETKYFLTSDENLTDGVRRILTEQLNAAIDELSHTQGSLDTAVHEARKSIKRSRSLLRLIRPAIGDAYSRENQRLQSVGRDLSELRDAQALIETLADLKEHNPHDSHAEDATDEFKAASDSLSERKEKIATALEANGKIQEAVARLRETLTNVAELSLKRVDFPIVTDSVKTTVKRGSKAFSKAYSKPKPENFHEFRKRVKDLRYQISLLTEIWPDVLEGYADAAEKLEQHLGDDHNLAVLDEVLGDGGNGDRKSPAIHKLARKRQAKIRDKAEQLGKRIYSEPAKVWALRLESSWKAWNAEKQ